MPPPPPRHGQAPAGRCAAVTRSFLPFIVTQPQAMSADHPCAADLDERLPDEAPYEQACEAPPQHPHAAAHGTFRQAQRVEAQGEQFGLNL